MKKLFLLLAAVAMFATACTEGGEEIDGQQPTGGPISVSQGRVNVDFEGKECELTVNAECSWAATCSANWITIQTPEGIAGKEPLKFIVKRNIDLSERKGTITLKNDNYNFIQEIYVIQSQFDPDIMVTDGVSLDFGACEQFVKVTSNVDYTVTDDADWLTCAIVEGGINLWATTNDTLESRSAKITITAKENKNFTQEISVIQSQFDPDIEVVNTVSLEFNACEKFVEVTSNVDYTVTDDVDWLTCEIVEGGINLLAQTNTTLESRPALITIKAKENSNFIQEIHVIQSQFNPDIKVAESVSLGFGACEKFVKVTSNVDYAVTDDADWLTCAIVEGGINLSATTNDTFDSRSAQMTITAKENPGALSINVTVVQTPPKDSDCVIYYTSSDGNIVNPYKPDGFGANIISNKYEDGQGTLLFDAPVTSIGDWAFTYCSSLTSVIIPDGVTSIGAAAFSGCTSLTSFYGKFSSEDKCCLIVDSTLVAFAPACGKTSYIIPDSVTSIGAKAFYYCNSLTSVTIGNSVTKIGSDAFCGCTSLTSVTIPNSVTSIGNSAFSYCSSLTSVTMPDSVTSIGDSAFWGCTSLTSVTIPDGVTSIGDATFIGCTSLKSITIPDSVTSIGSIAFSDCESLTSVTIPDSVTSIVSNAFRGCDSLTSIIVSESNTVYDSRDNCNAIIETATNRLIFGCQSTTIPDSVTSIGSEAFGDCTSLTSIAIPDSVTSIGELAFYYCTSLKSVTIGSGVTSIGTSVFKECTSLTSVTIPDSVTSIGYNAFRGCSSLKSVTIPDNVTSIGQEAFCGCSSLTSVTIPDGVTEIRGGAFSYCASLASVYCKPITPPSGYSSMFSKNASGRKIYVPRASVDAYKSAWSDYSSDIVGYDF